MYSPYFLSFDIKSFDTRQNLTFQQFQEGAATGGDVADLAVNTGLADGGIGIAAADDGGGKAVADRFGHGKGAAGKGIHLEDPHRAVPDNGLGVTQRLGEERGRGRADIERHPPFGNLLDRW